MSGRPIARLNATDVNVQFDQNSTTKQDGENFYGNVRDTDQGCFDVHEHDVLLQSAHQPHGMRTLSVFSSLRYKPKEDTDEARLKYYIRHFKYAGLGAEGFQQGQGFVATFTGLNVVRVAEDVLCGDILIAIPPLTGHDNTFLRGVIGKHTSPTMLVVSFRHLCRLVKKERLAKMKGLQGFVVGRCVGGARKGQMATVVLGPYNYEC